MIENRPKIELPQTSKAPETAQPTSAPALEKLGASAASTVRQQVEQATGEPLNLEELSNNPDKLGQTIERLAAVWNNAWEKIWAALAPLGIKPSEIDAGLNQPGFAAEDTKEETPAEWGSDKADFYDVKRAEHAAVALAKNPPWINYIREAAGKWRIPASTIIAFIEMESGFNSLAKPRINPKTGKPWSEALGLAQAMPSAIQEYRRAMGFPNANLSDPTTAIDFVGWHITDSIAKVNATVDREGASQGFPAEYKLTAASDIKYLYMTYNNGPLGYLVLRKYLENQTPENFAKLEWFQKRTQDGVFEWLSRANYAQRVAQVAKIYDAMNTGVEQYTSFDSPPLRGFSRISSEFGVRNHPIRGETHFHNGVDYPAPEGTAVLAVRNGMIEQAVTNGRGASGNYINVRHPDGSLSQYLHLSQVDVKAGQQVPAGTEIGAVGSTGSSTGPHLHFMFRGPDGIPRNPENAVLAALERKKDTAAA